MAAGQIVLSGDELGDAGETLFQNLASRARLVCNPSLRDRSGWDFVVDFPLAADSGQALDQRQKTSCYVQVKSTATTGNGTVSLKLSSADLLAKANGPAIVIVFRLRSDGEPLRGYLIHLIGAPLGKVLRRLRQADALGRVDIHNLKISFDYRKSGVAFDVTAAGLLQALSDACSEDPAAYAAHKLSELDSLGYEQGRYLAEAHFEVKDDSHLTRVLLGMAPLRPLDIETYDVRFGIALPYRGDAFNTVEELFLSPPSFGGCTIAVSGPPLRAAALFHAELLASPPVDGKLRMLVRHDDIRVLFQETQDQILVNVTFEARERTMAEMVRVLRALTYLAADGLITITGERSSFGPLRLPVRNALEGPYLEDLPELLVFASGWQQLTEMAGVQSDERIGFDDLWDRPARLAVELMTKSAPAVHFMFQASSLDSPGEEVESIYFNSCRFAGCAISYALKMKLVPADDDSEEYRSAGFEPIEVRPEVSDLNEYMDDLLVRFGSRVMIHPDNVHETES